MATWIDYTDYDRSERGAIGIRCYQMWLTASLPLTVYQLRGTWRAIVPDGEYVLRARSLRAAKAEALDLVQEWLTRVQEEINVVSKSK